MTLALTSRSVLKSYLGSGACLHLEPSVPNAFSVRLSNCADCSCTDDNFFKINHFLFPGSCVGSTLKRLTSARRRICVTVHCLNANSELMSSARQLNFLLRCDASISASGCGTGGHNWCALIFHVRQRVLEICFGCCSQLL
jgi:hypothetical protein